MSGRGGGLAHLLRQNLRRRARACHRYLLDKSAKRAALLLRIGRSVADHQPLAASELLPLREVNLDSERVELPACRHWQTIERLVNVGLKVEFSDHREGSYLSSNALGLGLVCCPGRAWPFSAGPGRATMSRASILDLQLGQMSSG